MKKILLFLFVITLPFLTKAQCGNPPTVGIINFPNTCMGAPFQLDCYVSNGTAPYTYQWSASPVCQIVQPNQKSTLAFPAGTVIFQVIVTDAAGCTASAQNVVTVNPPLAVSVTNLVNASCGQNNGHADILVNGGNPPYTYAWSNGQTGLTGNNLSAGSYTVSVVDMMGCTAVTNFTISQNNNLNNVVLKKGNITCKGLQNGFWEVSDTTGKNYSYQWSNAATSSGIYNLAPGIYSLTLTAGTCVRIFTDSIREPKSGCFNTINGKVYFDNNNNCMPDPNDPGIGGIIVRADPGGYIAFSRPDGNYSLEVDSGNYQVHVVMNKPGFSPKCPAPPANYGVTVNGSGVQIIGKDFSLDDKYNCPFIKVNISADRFRSCRQANLFVNYMNEGRKNAPKGEIWIDLPPELTYVSSSIPIGNNFGNKLRFNIDTIFALNGGYFDVQVNVACNAPLNKTLCVKAHAYPDTSCIPMAPGFDGSSIHTFIKCANPDVSFIIRNDGQGNMNASRQYRIFKDAAPFKTGMFQLNKGDSLVIQENVDGSAWRIEADQHPAFDKGFIDVDAMEGCGPAPHWGFIIKQGIWNGNPHEGSVCLTVRNSWDPNEKIVSPEGVGLNHLVDSTQKFNYHIGFQNTGNDTAYVITVLDTLSPFLDPASFHPGISSHSYSFKVLNGNVIEWTFNNINLVDSFKNEPKSHGFVEFSISQKKNNPYGSVIRNTAAIYFDSNAPVFTNTTMNTVGKIQFPVGIFNRGTEKIAVYPNPAKDAVFVNFEKAGNYSIEIRDITGRLMKTEILHGQGNYVKIADLPVGFYLYLIKDGNQVVAEGKLVHTN